MHEKIINLLKLELNFNETISKQIKKKPEDIGSWTSA
jgi:hypothetical protein